MTTTKLTPSNMKSIITQLNCPGVTIKESDVVITEVDSDYVDFTVNNIRWYVKLTKTGRVKKRSLRQPKY